MGGKHIMNVYEKLNQARVELQGKKLKQTGDNKFAGYKYYDLKDFLPTVNEIFKELKLFSHISFNAEVATMKVINTEKPDEYIEFTSPMAEANLKGCHPIQNIGAVQTYQRRYLYMMALEIVENDALDPTMDPNEKPKTGLSDAQVKRLYTIAGKKGYTTADVKTHILKKYNKTSVADLTKTEYDGAVKGYESAETK